jgi:hypothetical protein
MLRFRHTTLALALSWFAATSARAQQVYPPPPGPPADTAKNTLFVEGLGNGLIYSVNYERFVAPRFAIRIGAEYLGGTFGSSSETISLGLFPLMGTYLVGEGTHHAELGAGLTVATTDADLDDLGDIDAAVVPTATLGYRYQKPEPGFIFRIGFTPVMIGDRILPWGGISLGYAF